MYYGKGVCFAVEDGSRAIGDTDSLLDVLQQFSPFCRFENGAHHKNVLKEDVADISETALVFERYSGFPFLPFTELNCCEKKRV